MKKQGILHAELNRRIAMLGHTDTFAIGDSGLPLPPGVPVIDLALCPGQVPFLTVLDAITDEVVIQAHQIAQEASTSPAQRWFDQRTEALGERETITHEELKVRLAQCRFAIRTGERTAYANIICQAGVPF